LCDFEPGIKRWAGALLSDKMLLFCEKTESCKFELACLKKKKKEKHFKLAVWRLSDSLLLQCFLAPLGVLFVMKTLEV